MSQAVLDNSTSAPLPPDPKNLAADPNLDRRRPSRIYGLSTTSFYSALASASGVPSFRALRRTMSFIPRPFPPPALANVPIEYIIDQLHSLAPHYWSKPETADCTLVVPLETTNRASPEQVSRSLGSSPQPYPQPLASQSNAFYSGQKVVEPPVQPVPRMVMKLHVDYLASQSTLLRGIFSGVPPLELLLDNSPVHTPTPGSFPPLASRPKTSHTRPSTPLYPRVLPSSPQHPTLFLPVPDPASFRLLIHYMYFGSTAFLEDALDRGAVSWEGLARNVEYLGMNIEIKIFLGKWYGHWKRRREDFAADDYDSDSDESLDDRSDDDEDEDYDFFDQASIGTSVTLNPEDEEAIDHDFKQVEIESTRGRNRDTRRLGHAISEPVLNNSRPPPRLFRTRSSPRGRSE